MRSLFAAYAAIVLGAAAYIARHPEFNWDMIPYTAAVLSMRTQDPAVIHAETYRLVRQEVPPDRMSELLMTDYRKAVAESPRALMQQLPFYRIRPAYILSLAALARFGVSPARATVLVSIFAYIVLAVLVWAWLRAQRPTWLRVACATLIAVSQPLLHVAGLGNPDALSTAVVVLAFYLFVAQDHPHWALGLLLGSVLVRSDNVFLCVLFAAYLCWRERGAVRRLWPAVAAAAALGWVLVWHHAVGNYGWRLTMVHSFIGPLPLPAGGLPATSIVQLAKMWVGAIGSLRGSSLSLCLLVFLCAHVLRWRHLRDSKARDAALVLLASLVVHVAVFPNLEDRFFVAHYVILALVSASWLLEMVIAVQEDEAGHGRGGHEAKDRFQFSGAGSAASETSGLRARAR